MPFARPPSPSESHSPEELATSSRNAATSPEDADPTPFFDFDMGFHPREKDVRPRIEILLDKERYYLRGTGGDVEPARISGLVVLYLKESTSIKELTLQFRGKARIPTTSTDPNNHNQSISTYLLCSHEWSFLEGPKKHSHTLKAGRHVFPFQIQVGGSIPSSISTNAFGGAFVMYKFRAIAVRPGLSHNLQTVVPVTILRSFAPEALEYQQTLEIENTWPGKIMYSVMIPHKAYAAGDTVTAVVKFSPIAKGTSVLSVTSSITGVTKVSCRGTHLEHSRVFATTKHSIIDGKAFETTPSGYSTPTTHTPPSAHAVQPAPHYIHSSHGYNSSHPTTTQHQWHDSPSLPSTSNLTSSSHGSYAHSDSAEEGASADVITHVSIPIPRNITPTHFLEPITTSYRIRWSILIGNSDGHTSEVRCMLPLHVLDPSLLDEARSFTLASRRLLFLLEDEEEAQDAEGDGEGRELPSYDAHIRDRVANQYLSDASTLRVPNAWVQTGFSPTFFPSETQSTNSSTPSDSSLHTTLPNHPSNGPSTPLDWINSELLMSLRNLDENREFYRGHSKASESDSPPHSRSQSRHPSRPHSPERRHRDHDTSTVSGLNETIMHNSQASRSLQGIFSVTMKPFTSLSGPSHWFSGRSHTSHAHPTSTPPRSDVSRGSHTSHHRHTHEQTRHRGGSLSQDNQPAHDGPDLGQLSLHLAFTEVPDYSIAARGFLGGVPPLSSLQGLPSYEDTQKHMARSENVV